MRMRVVQVVRFGGPEVLVPAEAADPVAAPGQVVVEVSAADVLFLDAQLRRGAWSDHLPVEPPYVALDALVEVPDELDPRDAAALLHDGQTALGLVDAGAIRRDDGHDVHAA
jgi:NADPH2:quinone reductase